MKIQCQLSPQDYIHAQQLHLRPRPILKWLGIGLILVAVLACFQVGLHGERRLATPLVIAAALVYLAVMFGVVMPIRTRRIFRQQKTLQAPFEIELTDDAFQGSSVHGSLQLPWKDFHKYKQNERLILLYQSDALFHMLARRWFTDEQWSEVQGILARNLGRPSP